MSMNSRVFAPRSGERSPTGRPVSAGTCEGSYTHVSPCHLVWCCSPSANDIILGFIAGHLTRRFGCEGEVEWLNVVPARRRTGVAAALFHALATWFGSRQARRVCVDVNPHNAPARAFYRHHGAQDLNPHWLVWPDITAVAHDRVRPA